MKSLPEPISKDAKEEDEILNKVEFIE